MANKITVIIDAVADRATRSVKTFRQSVQEADGAVGKMKAGAKSLGDSLRANAAPAAAVAGAAAIKFGKDAVDAASNLEESVNAVNVAYGDAAEGVHELGENSVESFGLSRRAFNESATALSGFVDQIGGGAGTLDDLVGRATDFASVFNLDVSEALRVFQSTLAGETEPIRKFGKDLSAAAVTAHALETGLVASKSEMTEAIKVQARYSLLMEQTNDVAGDFANTQDSLANQSKTLAAEIEDLQAQLGEKLLPAVAELTGQLADLADVASKAFDFGESIDEVEGELGQLIDGVQEYAGVMRKMLLSPAVLGFGALKDSVTDASLAIDDLVESSGAATIAEGITARAAAEAARETELRAYWANQAADAAEDQADAERDLSRDVDRLTDEIEDQLDAIEELISSRRDLAGQTLDAREAELEWEEALLEAHAAAQDAETSAADMERQTIDLIRATDNMVTAQLESNGVIVDSERGNREWTRSMLDAANEMGGPLAREIIAHVARVNGIPEEKITEILAQLDQGHVDTARRMLDDALGETTSDVAVWVNEDALAAARRRISQILGRTVNIGVTTYVPGRTPVGGGVPPNVSHTGSIVPAGDTRAVTAAQAAWFTAGQGGFRMPSNEEARRALGAGGGGSPRVVNLTIAPTGVSRDEVEQLIVSTVQRMVRS